MGISYSIKKVIKKYSGPRNKRKGRLADEREYDHSRDWNNNIIYNI